jgi:glycine C-acetyltransferase
MTVPTDALRDTLQSIRDDGLYKAERRIVSAQGARIRVVPPTPDGSVDAEPREVLNFCANNYLGLASHPDVVAAARSALDTFGFGLASVRFICGTQTLHTRLEQRLSDFLGTEATILYPSCFDANGGLFETLLGPDDAVISDELNHASIIDGVRLCKARRFRYRNNDMDDLRRALREADDGGARRKLITTDGVFSMDGHVARLDAVCQLADDHDAMVHFDDCHATGFLGPNGRGTHEFRGCVDRVDITTGTLGKALGGGSGGYTSGRAEVIELLRQRSRPYLFSNTIAPPMVAGAMRAIELVDELPERRDRLFEHTRRFRGAMEAAGFELIAGEHPIVPVMLHDAAYASRFADALLGQGVYAIAFSYPVVPAGRARIRVQMNAAFEPSDIDVAVAAFVAARDRLGPPPRGVVPDSGRDARSPPPV